MFQPDLAFAKRPKVPPRFTTPGESFDPAPELERWMRDCFINGGSPLWNPEHEHLELAILGVLWTDVPLTRHGNEVAAMVELPQAQGNKWARARFEQLLRQWFGDVNLSYLITFFGPTCDQLTDAQFCALCEHELLHCGVKMRDGAPVEDDEGNLTFALRGHDVEEFVSVVRRYGAGNAAGATAELVRVAQLPPEIASVDIARCCGNCLK